MPLLRAGDLVSRSFSLAFRNLGAFLSTQGVLILAIALVSLFVTVYATPQVDARGDDAQAALALAGLSFLFSVVAVFVGIASTGVGLHVADGLARGERLALGDALARTRPRYGNLLATLLAFFGVALGASALVAFIAILGLAASPAAGVALAILAGCAAIVAVIAVYARWGVAVPLSALERLPAGENLRRSTTLTEGSRGALVGAFFVVGLVTGIPGGIAAGAAAATYALSLDGAAIPLGTRIVVWLVQTVGNLAGAFLFSALGALAYRDLAAETPAAPAPAA